MKTPLTYIVILLLLGACVYMYFDKPSGHTQQLIKERKRSMFIADSLKTYYERELVRKDSAFFQLFKKTQENANKWESEAKESQRKLKIEIGKRRSFNDKQTDSLLNEVR